ncbi:MAG TPA: NAD(P)/FAD-dependent oxidoreductase, partial [Thermoanaerobaculia bacterium]|nr:NAD(P)/FAD-dependent oxidoreductase [Thermoanaerobaculia bacterium]
MARTEEIRPERRRAKADLDAEVLVLGSGPGGYTAAFRAADLGKKVVLVERYPTLGGVCLNVGCIPSKALLHAAKVIDEAAEMAERGVRFGRPEIDLDALRSWKDSVVAKLTKGLSALATRRNVTVVRGTGTFASPHTLEVAAEDGGRTKVSFDSAIVAAGSRVVELAGIPWDDPRVLDSTRALELREVPKRLLVVGGGIIGLELAGVFSALGSEVT